jgi:nitroreductase/NAD-dependent dihydropyrimidine dehydrogenase PreA subunit
MQDRTAEKKAVETKPTPYKRVAGTPRVDHKKCTDCGLCYDLCFVFEKRGDRVEVVRPRACLKCGHCGSLCPSNAIRNSTAEPKRMTAKHQKSLPSPDSLQFLLRSRRSVRRYKKKPISRKHMSRILEAGRYTPTGANNQAIQYIVIVSPDKIEELRKMTLPSVMRLFKIASYISTIPILSTLMLGEQFTKDFEGHLEPAVQAIFERTSQGQDKLFYDAPALMLVHGEKNDDMAFSCSAALFNCSIMAHTLGIGCCLNGFLALAANQDKKIKRWLGIPRLHKCHGAMTLGYQALKFNSLVQRHPAKVKWV